MLAPEERVEAAGLRLSVDHPLERLPLEGIERKREAGRVHRLRVACRLQCAHKAGEGERMGIRLGLHRLVWSGRRAARCEHGVALHGRRARRLDKRLHRRDVIHQ